MNTITTMLSPQKWQKETAMKPMNGHLLETESSVRVSCQNISSTIKHEYAQTNDAGEECKDYFDKQLQNNIDSTSRLDIFFATPKQKLEINWVGRTALLENMGSTFTEMTMIRDLQLFVPSTTLSLHEPCFLIGTSLTEFDIPKSRDNGTEIDT